MKGLEQMIGNGKSLSVWIDFWLHDERMKVPWIKNTFIDLKLIVNDLIDVSNIGWKRERDWKKIYFQLM